MQVVRVNQRGQDDCAICTTAMVLGYSYKRVLHDRQQLYPQFDDKTAWWEWYFQDEGRWVAYLPLDEFHVVQIKGSSVLGVLHLTHPTLQVAHVAVIDELGVVDPSDGFPDHMAFGIWMAVKMSQGFVLDSDFLAVGISDTGTGHGGPPPTNS